MIGHGSSSSSSRRSVGSSSSSSSSSESVCPIDGLGWPTHQAMTALVMQLMVGV